MWLVHCIPLPVILEPSREGPQALHQADREEGPDRAPSLGAGWPEKGRESPVWTVTDDPHGRVGGAGRGKKGRCERV